ncbi:MAG: DUF4423 domain-containing protein [Bdellovibrionia bacterium]
MDLYTEDNYKIVLKKRVKDLARTKKSFTLTKVAKLIPIQNTYLSRVLNDEKTHLNEDHLFKMCKLLEFFPQEIDYLFLLRSRALATDASRAGFLDSKINRIRQESQRSASFQEFGSHRLNQEMAYLFDPLCTLVHVALFIDEHRTNPRKLGSQLGITQARLKQILAKLRDVGFIELESDFEVKAVNQNQVHYGTDHPLMRTHQSLLRSKGAAQLNNTPEDEKHCFMGTFSADPETFAQIKSRFQAFLKEAEALVTKAPSKSVYQMNFDLFKWV